MAVPVNQTSFANGEIAPALWGHVDLSRTRSAATTMRNMYVGYRGGSYSRAGTKFVGFAKQNPLIQAIKPRLIGFEFSLTQTVVLELGNLYMRFISQGGYVTNGSFTIVNATRANPCVITAANTLVNGQWIVISGVGGMTQLNGNSYIVAGRTPTSFELQDTDGNPVNSSAYGAYTSGGTAALIYEISTPYIVEDLPTLKFTQSADVISLTHPNYPPYDLARHSSTNWTLTATSFAAPISPPASASATATTHPSSSTSPPTLPTAYAYEVTAVDKMTGGESIASPIANVTNSVDIAATAGSIVISWSEVANAQYYNIYKAPASYNTGSSTNASPVPVGALFGFVASAFGNQYVDSNVTANPSITPPLHQNPFAPGQITGIDVTGSTGTWTTCTVAITSATGSGFIGAVVISGGAVVAVVILNPGQNYQTGDVAVFTGDGASVTSTVSVGPETGTNPSVVAYFQQRRFYASSLNNPDTIWGSQPGTFANFDAQIPVTDSSAITATPWSEMVEGVQWMISMPLGLVIFTGNSVWQLSAPGSFALSPAALTPTNMVAAPQSSIGSSPNVKPQKINWDILYLDAHNSTVRDLAYQLYFNVYTGVDISWQSSHLLQGHTIVEWAWSEVPNRVLWMVRDDGVLLSLTYLKEQEVVGWARHDTQGLVRSICTISELPVDAVYIVVQRPLPDSTTRYFVERMDNRLWTGIEDSWCVDCGLTLPLTKPNTPLAATAASGSGVTFFTGTPGPFTVQSVGQIIRMGGGIAEVTSYVSAQTVLGTWLYPCQQIYANDVNNLPIQQDPGNWSIAAPVTTISGLGHLNGKQVTGLADGIVISPRTVTNGSITLDRAASLVTVGLGFTAQLQTVYLDMGNPTVQGRRKAMFAVTARVEGSGAIQVGANQNDASAFLPTPTFEVWDLPPAQIGDTAPKTYTTASGGTVQPLYTGDIRIPIASDWKKPGQAAVQQSQPMPMAILDIVPEVLPGDTPEEAYTPRQERLPRPSLPPQRAGRAAA